MEAELECSSCGDASSCGQGSQRLPNCSDLRRIGRDEARTLAKRLLEDKLGEHSSVPPQKFEELHALVADLLVGQSEEELVTIREHGRTSSDRPSADGGTLLQNCEDESVEREKENDAGAAAGGEAGTDSRAGPPVSLSPIVGQSWDYPLSRSEKVKRLHLLWDFEVAAAEEENKKAREKVEQLAREKKSVEESAADMEQWKLVPLSPPPCARRWSRASQPPCAEESLPQVTGDSLIDRAYNVFNELYLDFTWSSPAEKPFCGRLALEG